MAGVKARQILTATGGPGAARKSDTDPTKGLSESQTHQLLRAYGIRTPREQLVTSAAWAVRAAATIGYPVVMKASVAGLPSASAAGLTRTTITSASQVRENFKDLMDSAGRQGYGTLDGVLIGQQITGGVDTMVGIRRDDRFGPAVVVGVGGAYAETLGDVAIRVAPFDAYQAHRMLDELHCLPLLTNAGADLEALADTILRVQRMALDLGDVLEGFDIAPLRVLGRGGGTVALDARRADRALTPPPIRFCAGTLRDRGPRPCVRFRLRNHVPGADVPEETVRHSRRRRRLDHARPA